MYPLQQRYASRRTTGMMAALVLVLAMMVSFSVANAPNASAASACSTNLVDSKPLRSPSGANSGIGRLELYYNSSTGNNCAMVVHTGASYGVAAETYVSIIRCAETVWDGKCDGGSGFDSDYGNFSYYAGGVRVHAPNNCISTQGSIKWNGVYHTAKIGGHC